MNSTKTKDIKNKFEKKKLYSIPYIETMHHGSQFERNVTQLLAHPGMAFPACFIKGIPRSSARKRKSKILINNFDKLIRDKMTPFHQIWRYSSLFIP